MPPESVDLIYVDPPFFTQKVHSSVTRDGSQAFSFRDIWINDNSYADFVYQRIARMHDVLSGTGSIFFHCDKSASHIVRLILDSVFSTENFRSEIVWHFKRWSNSKKGLLSAHQTIFFYSKTDDFKFNTFYQEYSPSTNIDQIMQKRVRDDRNKSVYARTDDGAVISNGSKKGVPLSDVWEIPFLNPKAKERVGYPTQKPVRLLNQIIKLATDEGDVVLDPFCGSGTTLVAAQLLKRHSIGIDISSEAIKLTKDRLQDPIVTSSVLLEKGAKAYRQYAKDASKHLVGIDYLPVHRNKGIDGLLKQEVNNLPAFVRVQRDCEALHETIAAIKKSTKDKGACCLVVIATLNDFPDQGSDRHSSSDVLVIPSTALSLSAHLGGDPNGGRPQRPEAAYLDI
ncbi:MAG: site-specific DNA-methyltransferase [Rhodobacteraceae bacterium]|nr:site-specific DNA-methyltransferase [Paracoccaceae bacterium]